MILDFEVKRKRFSVTQQEAHVYCNGKFIINFGDDPKMINPGDKYYGELIGGWASTKPDAQFIRSALYHKYDEIYHYSDGIKQIIDEAIAVEVESANRRAENDI